MITPLTTSAFNASAASADAAILLVLTGSAESPAKDAFDAFLDRVHTAVVGGGAAKEVVVDLRGLEFMNSSCFKCLVTWTSRVEELPADKQYRMRFVSNPKVHWQSRSLHALKCFATNLITIE